MTDIAVFGAGRIGRVHALNAAAQPSLRVRYLVDPGAGAGRDDLAARLGAAVVEAGAVFADPAIAGVVIASSTDTHADLLERAAAAGKAVFCEKPVSLDFAAVERVAARVAASGIPCMLGFQRRYDPDFRAVRDRIASGASGALEHVVMHTRDPAPPLRTYVERSGGMFRDQAIHDFDMARYLLGEEIRSVFAVGACLIDPEIGAAGDIDTAMVTLTSASGRFVQMVNCRRAPFGYDQRLEAICAREALYVDNRPATTIRIGDAAGFRTAPPESYFIERFAGAYHAEMAAFADLLATGAPPLAGIADGLEAQRLAEAAIVAMQTGAPVTLTPDWRPS
ncbi:inositol 2-dehydrogenase [Amaricoccus sp.]|uniref:inositol 2-dehydrogenase n=1 Tax=Amaricoccus sp. TaxID=1872485 RepID=UPI001B58E351|nr:inositol 2-dehydrogenase [Amaricoccus sp.]MBP7002705.1 inositol 2-dehydrogenase [Amaricoccus sp.]